MRLYILCSIFLLFGISLQAQSEVISPAADQTMPIVITGVTAHLGNGRVIENAAVAFEKGKITWVGKASSWKGTDDHQMIVAKGKHLYPGLIAANTTLGLEEISAVRATVDSREVGAFNPNVRSLIAYNTDSEVIPTLRTNGVLTAQICPRGGWIPGSSSVVHLDAWNWEDAVLKVGDGIHVNWPRSYSYNWRLGQRSANDKYNDQVAALRDFFTQAQAYSNTEEVLEKNLKFEAMRSVFNKQSKCYIRANEVVEMQDLIYFAKDFDLDLVIIGGQESWRITDLLVEQGVPVVLGQVHALPANTDSDIDQPFKTPAMLQDAGVLFCISIDDFWQVRNLAFQAGHTVGFGMDKEDALRAVTSSAAEIMGLGEELGQIKVGYRATLFISEGDALDYVGNSISRIFIDGRDVSLQNKQKALYEKFKTKYQK